jgi:hypothetical protein
MTAIEFWIIETQLVSGPWSTSSNNGQWSAVHGQHPAINGQWSAVNGPWSTSSNQWSMVKTSNRKHSTA